MSTAPRIARQVSRVAASGSRSRLVPTNDVRSLIRPGPTRAVRHSGPSRRAFATASEDPLSPDDPSSAKALEFLEKGTKLLEEGDLAGALGSYRDSIGVKETGSGWFNLGVCQYHQGDRAAAIEAWEKSIAISPSADAYTNLASAYVMSKPPNPALAIEHLTSAMELAPDDPEIAFNLAAILESTDKLEPALQMYQRAEQGGIERATQNIRNISAKILSRRSQQNEQ